MLRVRLWMDLNLIANSSCTLHSLALSLFPSLCPSSSPPHCSLPLSLYRDFFFLFSLCELLSVLVGFLIINLNFQFAFFKMKSLGILIIVKWTPDVRLFWLILKFLWGRGGKKRTFVSAEIE